MIGSGGSRHLLLRVLSARFDGASNTGYVTLSFQSETQDGTSTLPWVLMNSVNSEALFITDTGIDYHVDGALRLPSATADPTGPGTVPETGHIYVNTSANELRVYEGGAWRVVGSW